MTQRERRLEGVGELTPERLAELRRIAEAATPGPWKWREREHNERIRKRGQPWSRRQFIYCLQGPPLSDVAPEHRDEFDYHTVMSLRWDDRVEATPLTGVVPTPADADFIATFDPPTVLALLDEIERLRRERDAALDVLGREDIGDGAVARRMVRRPGHHRRYLRPVLGDWRRGTAWHGSAGPHCRF